MGSDVGHVFLRGRAATLAWGLCGLTAALAVPMLLLLANVGGQSTPGDSFGLGGFRGLSFLASSLAFVNRRGARGSRVAREPDRLDRLLDGPPGRSRRLRLTRRGLRAVWGRPLTAGWRDRGLAAESWPAACVRITRAVPVASRRPAPVAPRRRLALRASRRSSPALVVIG